MEYCDTIEKEAGFLLEHVDGITEIIDYLHKSYKIVFTYTDKPCVHLEAQVNHLPSSLQRSLVHNSQYPMRSVHLYRS